LCWKIRGNKKDKDRNAVPNERRKERKRRTSQYYLRGCKNEELITPSMKVISRNL
jgi:hypothetical protein